MISTSSVELEKSRNMMPGGAIGATESRNKLGMLVVVVVVAIQTQLSYATHPQASCL